MEDLFRWSLITAFVVSLATFILNFMTKGIGISLIVAIILTIASVIYFMKKYGVPDSSFATGGIIGIAAIVGMISAKLLPPFEFWSNFLEYFLTIILFVIAYFLGGFIGKWTYGGQTEPRRKREEEEPEEPEEIEERQVSGE